MLFYFIHLFNRHPDKVGKQGEQAYLDMVRAYDVLRDPESRKEYEQLLREGLKSLIIKFANNYQLICF